MNSPIDILILTALPEERDAVLAIFQGTTKWQKENSLTYYLATLPLANDLGHYRIGVAMLQQIGNVDAAQYATRAIHELRPTAVLMVGIAGGIAGKVSLGDVLVANQVFYYESGKLLDGKFLGRPRSLLTDQALLERAQHIAPNEWQELIAMDPPVGIRSSQCHFGPIASGESVVADANFVAELKTFQSNIMGIDMESYGIGLAAASTTSRPRFLSIRGISDYADSSKDDGWHNYAAASAAAFVFALLRTRPVPQGGEPAQLSPQKEFRRGTLLIVRHSSSKSFPTRALEQSLPRPLRAMHLVEHEIDHSDLVIDGRLTDPLEAVRRQISLVDEITNKFNSLSDVQIAYYGIAHIPLLFQLGLNLLPKHRIIFFEYDRETGFWNLLDGRRNWPKLKVKGLPQSRVSSAGDVTVRICVSYPVTEEDTLKIVANPIASIEVSVPVPTLDIVRSRQQIVNYGSVFRIMLDSIHNRLPNARRIHIFYAGPVSLAVNLGRQISRSIDPGTVVYNYFLQDEPHYSWGLNITEGRESASLLIQAIRLGDPHV